MDRRRRVTRRKMRFEEAAEFFCFLGSIRLTMSLLT